jgi:hypothetical protein
MVIPDGGMEKPYDIKSRTNDSQKRPLAVGIDTKKLYDEGHVQRSYEPINQRSRYKT